MTCSLAHVWAQVPRKASTRDNGFLCVVTCTRTYTPDTSRTIGKTLKDIYSTRQGPKEGEKHKSF